MKGVIIAGGKGTRMGPLAETINKHLLPAGREPMIWHPVKQLVNAGIDDILVVASGRHLGDMAGSLGSGRRFGCELTYKVQEEPGGIAHALALAEGFSGGDRIVVLLGDNIFQYALSPHIQSFRGQGQGARVLLKEVEDPARYGVATLEGGRVVKIEEKPHCPKSRYAVVGCYMYGPRVFDLIRRISPSGRNELEITAVNNLYIEEGRLEYGFVQGRWADAGTFESWFEANHILFETGNRLL